MPHLGTTYPAVLSVALLQSEEAYQIIDRQLLRKFILSTKSKTDRGAFCIHVGGEEDLRALYIAVLCGDFFNILDGEVADGIVEYVVRCQTYEGGIAPNPNSEAHAGYTYCGVAALAILNKLDSLNIPRLIDWATNKQKELEGGFCGRTNKLVDSCYSVWLGSIFSILNESLGFQFQVNGGHMLYDQLGLQKYILMGCQTAEGGLVDKLGKKVDFYHTAYSLSGLSMAQRLNTGDAATSGELHLFGNSQNLLEDIDPRFNIPRAKVTDIRKYFRS